MNIILDINHLSFAYDKKRPVLKDICLQIEEKSITALMGKNGSGKSTLLECILGINVHSFGSIMLYGRNLADFSPSELACQVAYISQNTVINMDYDVRDFLLFGRTPHIKNGRSLTRYDYNKVENLATEYNISHLLDKSIRCLSGGERQLVFLCRALAQDTELFIFDEPTSALDYGNQYRFFSIIRMLREQGKTILFTTHNPDYVLKTGCDVAILNEQKILAHGASRDILTQDMIKTIYGSLCFDM